ncbi:MAG: molybdate ABC transporter substrate-binding protein [Rhodospirillales bacterium]|nr:molybdate ABC transporter substrate-binding protein [Rhodospirillales bacterium]
MTNAVEAIVNVCGSGQTEPIKASFAASSVLAKQIDNGAAAAVYLSANVAWMDYLEKRNRLVANTRHRLSGNSLVVIAPVISALPEGAELAEVFAAMPGDGRVAMGDPEHVPAGYYAKAALNHVRLWDRIRGKAANTANVRAALALVEAAAVPLGIVYRTDALVSRKVRVVAEFPQNSHPPITYEAALVRGHDTAAARRVFECMLGRDAANILARHGFFPSRDERYADGR